jgi:hypothetical protein
VVGWEKMPMREKRVDSSALMADLCSALEEIAQCQTVFIVALDAPTFRGDHEFVLGPESVCRPVLGLVDPEYGWPKRVDAEQVDDVMALAPGYRRHPFIYHGGKCVAVGIHVCEYEEIRKRSS